MLGHWGLEECNGVCRRYYREMFVEQRRPRTASVSVARALMMSALCQIVLSGPL